MKIIRLDKCIEMSVNEYTTEMAKTAKNDCNIIGAKFINGNTFKLEEIEISDDNNVKVTKKDIGENYYKIVITDCGKSKKIFIIELSNYNKDNSEDIKIKIFKEKK